MDAIVAISDLCILITSPLGPHIGSILSFPISAVLCQYGFDGGWPSVFYVFGECNLPL